MTNPALTSGSNPLRIAELPAGRGLIGITFLPGKHQNGMTGRHRRDLATDLDTIAAWNASAVVTLVEDHELERYRVPSLGEQVRLRHMEWHHWPIPDFHAPDAAFDAGWPDRSAMLRAMLARGGRVLVHCKGGLGRAGSIAARLLVDDGMAPGAAMAAVRAVRPGAIEVSAQERWLMDASPAPLPQPARDRDAARDRALGALLGLAVGDALGAAIEFSAKPRLALLSDLEAGGPHRLERGQWTDDTAMALALADSLHHDPALDVSDLMRRFVGWHERGTYSCTGVCFDIGNATRAALDAFRRTGSALAGSPDPNTAGNGALMRLAPVAIRHWRDRAELARIAELQTRTTHAAPATLHASDVFATMLADAIAGLSLNTVLASAAAERIEGGWRGLHRDRIRGSGYVVHALQAAVWAVAHTTDFRSAVLLAANLGEDADTTAAVAGQLAGAIYGASGIPAAWLDALAWRERLEQAAASLFDAVPEGIEQHAFDAEAPWEKDQPTLRDRLAALAAFASVFDAPGFSAVTDDPVAEPGVYYGVTYSQDAGRFVQMAYDQGWVRILPWSDWRSTPRGARLMSDPAAMAEASVAELSHVLTTCLRADRFCDGYLADAFKAGLIGRVVKRAEQLLWALPRG
jgi:ADP-ribosyl-[dinitrogen reductase] hydrolase